MNKLVALLLVLITALSLFACGSNENNENKTEKAFSVSKEAYQSVKDAYERVNNYSTSIYEAWYIGIHEKEDYDGIRPGYYYTFYTDSELTAFAEKIGVKESDAMKAITNILGIEEYTRADNYELIIPSSWVDLQSIYENFFSACVAVASEAYKCSGEIDIINNDLSKAKDLMKSLSDNYSDYEHYPALKNFFANTMAMFDFCQNPEGSFEQVVETFNDYRNKARDYMSSLDYVFN